MSCKEPVWYRECSFSNENAELYILNYTGNNLLVLLEKSNGSIEEITIPNEELQYKEKQILDDVYAVTKKNNFVFSNCSYMNKNGDGTRDFFLPADEKNLLLQNLDKSDVVSISIKNSSNEIMYKSEIIKTSKDFNVILMDSGLGGTNIKKLNDYFKNGHFFFKNRPGDILYIDCEVDIDDKPNNCYGAIKNPRYLIVMGDGTVY